MTDPLVGLRPSRVTATVPWWFERVVGGFAAAIIGFGLVGMVLALIGWFRIGPGLALGTATSYSIFAQWFRSSPRSSSSWRLTVPAVAASAIAVGSLFFNWTAAGEPMLTDGEQGVMVVAARHLDVTGSLAIEAAAGPFTDARVGFVADGLVGSGIGGTLETAVPHLVSVYRGIGGWFGQTPLLAIGALLGAGALMAFYSFAARIVHPPIAVILTAALAVSLPFVQASRGAYPEIVGLAATLSGLGLLWGLSRSLDPWRGAIAGVLLAMPVLARPEWAVLVIPFGVFVALEFVESTRGSWLGARSRRRFLLALAGGFGVPVLVAVADGARSGLELGATFEPRRAATVLAVVAVLLGTIRLAGRILGEQPRLAYADMRRGFAYMVAGVVIVGAVVAVLRPAVVADEPSSVVAEVQEAEGVDIDPTRSYDEATGLWAVWYLGAFSVIVGTIGLALMVVEATEVEGRRTMLFLLITLIGSFAVLVDAGPEPVQVAASRRLLAVTIPGLLIGAGVVAQRLYDAARRYVTPMTVAAAAGLVIVIATPLSHLKDVAGLSDHRGARAGVAALCESLDRRDAVLFAESATAAPGSVAVQTVRDFCRIPAARAVEPSPDEIAALASEWKAEGRRLMMISAEPWPGLEGTQRLDIAWRSLERTAESRPDGPEVGSLSVYLAPAE